MADEMRSFNIIDMDLATLANLTSVQQATKIDTARLQGCVPGPIEYSIEYTAKPATTGPLIYGLVDSLSNAELAEWFAADPQHDADAGESEASTRSILILGYILKQGTATSNDGLGDAGMIKRLRWPGWDIIEGEQLAFFVFNLGIALTGNTLIDGFLNVRGDWSDK